MATSGTGTSDMQLRVTQVWRGEIMEERIFAAPTTVRFGPAKGCEFVIPDLGLPPSFAMFRPSAKGYVLTLGQGMSGRLHLGGQEQAVEEFVAGGGPVDRAEGSAGSFRAVPVGPGDWGIVKLDGEGHHTVVFQFTAPEEKLPANHFQDGELLRPSFAFSLFLHGVLLALVWVFLDYRPNRMVVTGIHEAMTGYLVRRPEPIVPPPEEKGAEKKAGTEDGDPEAPAASTAGDPGKAGGEGDKPRARDPEPGPAAPSSRDAIVRAVRNQGILKHRDKLAAVTGRGALDDRLAMATSRLKGPLADGGAGSGTGRGTGVGPGIGTGTLTRGGGTGPGGGGTAHADIVTSGVIDTGGSRAPRGTPGGKGVSEVAVSVSTGKAEGDLGDLTAEQINKVVLAHKNAIQYCFVKELQRYPNLDGKVIVTWWIGPSGTVTHAKIRSSTMNNAAVEDCIVRQVRKWKFPAPGGSQPVVNYPFIFAKR